MKYTNIALRNLGRQKRRFALLGGAIAFGTMILLLVNGFSSGVSDTVRNNIAELASGHIFISREVRRESGVTLEFIEDDTELMAAMEELGYTQDDIQIRSELSRGSVEFNGTSANLSINGVDFAREESLRENLNIIEGSWDELVADPEGLAISIDVAADIGAKVGDLVSVRGETITGQENYAEFTLRALTQAGNALFGDFSAYAHKVKINEVLNIPADAYQSLSVFAPSLAESAPEADRIEQYLRTVLPFPEPVENEGFNFSLNLENVILFGDRPEPYVGERYEVRDIYSQTEVFDNLANTVTAAALGLFVFLMLIIMVGIINTFRIIMYERVGEIGTMRSMGVQKDGIRAIFLQEASFLALLSLIGGVIASAIVGLIVGAINFGVDSPAAIFLKQGQLSFALQPEYILLTFGVLLVLTLLAAFIPARNAANMSPADALRAVY